MPGLRHSAAAFLFPLVLGGCGGSYSPNTYSSAAVQQANKVDTGVVIGARRVDVTASGVVGGTAGAAAGSAAGASVPGTALGSTLTAIGGGLLGGAVGLGVERATGDTFAFEYIVKKDNNELVSVTQKDKAPLPLGQRVLVIAGSQARIVPDYTFRAEPASVATVPQATPAGAAAVTLTLPKAEPPAATPAAGDLPPKGELPQ